MSLLRRAAAEYRLRRYQVRTRASWVRTGAERHLIARRPHADVGGPRILCYHSVGTPSWGVNDVTPAAFARQLELALEAGYTIVPAAELAVPDTAGGDGPDRRLAVTFDDGVRSVLTHAAPALRELGVPWTAFVVTDWAEGRHDMDADLLLDWHGIEALAEAGATIASHSVTHPNFGKLRGDRTADELGRSREAILDRLGIDTTEFAIPFGQSGNWTPEAHAAARSAGYRTVYAQSVDRRPADTVPRTFITSFDSDRIFGAALRGAFDGWEEWV